MSQNRYYILFEIAFSRVLPGVIGAFAFVLLASKLEVVQYGIFSTFLATVAFISNIIFGPVKFSVLPAYAKLEINDKASKFIGEFLSIFVFLLIVSIALLTACYGFYDSVLLYAYLVFVLGVWSTLQPVLHARLDYWKYGLVSVFQAAIFFIYVLLQVDNSTSSSDVLAGYSASVTLAALGTYYLIGTPKLRVPSSNLLSVSKQYGLALTISNAAENGLFVGYRYFVASFSTPEILGLFSIAVDLAQKLIGFVLKILGFAVLPRAFRAGAYGDFVYFKFMLQRVAFWSVLFFAALLPLLYVGTFFDFKFVGYELSFDSVMAFTMVAAAIFINGLKKIILDPLALVKNRSRIVPLGYIYAIVPGFSMGLVSSSMGFDLGIYASYFVAYLVCYLFTWLSVSKLDFSIK